MEIAQTSFGVVDARFLSRSVGLLNPPLAVSVSESEVIERVLFELRNHKIGCVLVTDEQGELVGIFSERDVVLKVSLCSYDLTTTPISEVMTPNPQTIRPTDSVAHALHMMSIGGYRHLPVVEDDGMIVGLISVKDLVDYVAQTVSKDLSKA